MTLRDMLLNATYEGHIYNELTHGLVFFPPMYDQAFESVSD